MGHVGEQQVQGLFVLVQEMCQGPDFKFAGHICAGFVVYKKFALIKKIEEMR